MPVPVAAIAIPAALTLLSILSNASATKKNRKQQEKQIKLDKIADRRAAIERSLNSGFQPRQGKTLEPANVTNQAILSGIGQLGAQVGFSAVGQKFLGGDK